MKVMVLDTLIQQTDGDNYVPRNVIPLIFAEYQTFAKLEQEGVNSLQNYLKNKHGIIMKGAEHIYKYELTDGDRILYTYGEYLPWTKDSEKETLVLISFAKHDDQGYVARNYDLSKHRGYQYVSEIVKQMEEQGISADDEFNTDDIVALAELLNDLSYSNWHKIYVTSDEDYACLSYEEMDFRLSKEQDTILSSFNSKPKPTMIIGGAGTGKTVIAVHALHDFSLQQSIGTGEQLRGSYFTQSPELRTKVESIYKKLQGIDACEAINQIEFKDVNDYCFVSLGESRRKFVNTERFLEFAVGNDSVKGICSSAEISFMDVWTEIRGTIKGAMSAEWTHTEPLSQDLKEFSGDIKNLVDKGYFIRTSDKKKIVLSDRPNKISEKAKNDEKLSPAEKRKIDFAVSYFSSFDGNKRSMSREEYEKTPEERTTLPKSKRQFVWDIFLEYEKYLAGSGLLDENDLVRMMFSRGKAEKAYDFVAVDEVQDYTELQLFLLTSLARSGHVILAGDEHQNINPASFSESRIKSLFSSGNGTNLVVERLNKNFRCQQKIIDVTNNLAEIRRSVIAKGSAENEQKEEAQRDGFKPQRLRYTDSNFKALLKEIEKYPRAVVLVPDEKTKTEVKDKIQLKDRPSKIFTVSEIKGMEYQYVVVFDAIAVYSQIWERMLSGDVEKKQSKYRYYFNLLYVAATRAQDYLCFIDRTSTDLLDGKLDIKAEAKFDAAGLHFNMLSADLAEFLTLAKDYESNGRYDDAIDAYIAGNSAESDILRCRYLKAYNVSHKYDEALLYAMLLDSTEYVQRCMPEVEGNGGVLGELFIKLHEDEPHDLKLGTLNVNNRIDEWINELGTGEDTIRLKSVILGLMANAAASMALSIGDAVK